MISNCKIFPKPFCSVYGCENKKLVKLKCPHYLCKNCKENLLNKNCPLCREPIIDNRNKETCININESLINQNVLYSRNNCSFVFLTICWTKLSLQIMLIVSCYSLISFLLTYILCQNEKNFHCIQCFVISFLGPLIFWYPILYFIFEKLQNYKHKKKINILWSLFFSIIMFIMIGTTEDCKIKYFLLWTPVVWFMCFYCCIFNYTKTEND